MIKVYNLWVEDNVAFPLFSDTILTEGGDNFSVGQRQVRFNTLQYLRHVFEI